VVGERAAAARLAAAAVAIAEAVFASSPRLGAIKSCGSIVGQRRKWLGASMRRKLGEFERVELKGACRGIEV